MPLTLLLSFLCLRLIKNSEFARSQVIISNPTFYHAPSNQEKLPKAFQKQLWASPPIPVLHHLVRVTRSSHKNLQTFTKPVPSSVHRGSGAEMLFLCHVTAVSDPLHQAQLLPMAGNEPSPMLPMQQSNTKEFIPADRFPSPVQQERLDVHCSFQLVTQPGSPTKSIWGEELMLQQRAVLRLAIYTVCDVNLLQFGLSGILWVHIPMSQYWFLMRTNGSLLLVVSSARNEVSYRDCTSFTYCFASL